VALAAFLCLVADVARAFFQGEEELSSENASHYMRMVVQKKTGMDADLF